MVWSHGGGTGLILIKNGAPQRFSPPHAAPFKCTFTPWVNEVVWGAKKISVAVEAQRR